MSSNEHLGSLKEAKLLLGEQLSAYKEGLCFMTVVSYCDVVYFAVAVSISVLPIVKIILRN
jgi:hypothetical protein